MNCENKSFQESVATRMAEMTDGVETFGGNTTFVSSNVRESTADDHNDNIWTEQHSETGEIVNNSHGTAINDQMVSANASSGIISFNTGQDLSLEAGVNSSEFLEAAITVQAQSNYESSGFNSFSNCSLTHHDEPGNIMREQSMTGARSHVRTSSGENATVHLNQEGYQSKACGLISNDHVEATVDNLRQAKMGCLSNETKQLNQLPQSDDCSSSYFHKTPHQMQHNMLCSAALLHSIQNVQQDSDEAHEELMASDLESVGTESLFNICTSIDTNEIRSSNSSVDATGHDSEICNDEILIEQAYFQTDVPQNDQPYASQEYAECDATHTLFNQGASVHDTSLKYSFFNMFTGAGIVVSATLGTIEQDAVTHNEQYAQTDVLSNTFSESNFAAEPISGNNSLQGVNSGVAYDSVADQHDSDQAIRVRAAAFREEQNRASAPANLWDQQNSQIIRNNNLEMQQGGAVLSRIHLEVGDRTSDVNLLQTRNVENPPFPISTDIQIHDNDHHTSTIDIDIRTGSQRLIP